MKPISFFTWLKYAAIAGNVLFVLWITCLVILLLPNMAFLLRKEKAVQGGLQRDAHDSGCGLLI
jgi:hypothetical protein